MPLSLSPSLLMSSASSVAFSPAALFAAGEPGAWYDPSDLTTMFQDTAGTTPVTATGQTVGLLLDKSKGLVLGPELVTNGDFSQGATGWTVGTGWSVSGGTANASSGGDYEFSQNIGAQAGKFYRVTYTITARSSGDFAVNIGNASTPVQWRSAPGTYTEIITPAGGSISVLWFRTRLGFTGTIDNISVKELPGNHATQATAASRPIYGIEPFGGRRNLATFTEQFDNAAWTKLNATITANNAAAPDGTMTADKLIATAVSGSHFVAATVVMGAAAHSASAYFKAAEYTTASIFLTQSGNNGAVFNLSNGTVSSVTGTGNTATIVDAGNGWYRCVVTNNGSADIFDEARFGPSNGAVSSFTGNGTDGILIWGAQLETGSTATAYQRVTDQWNVTQAGVPSVAYLAFDGTDDFLLTGTITPGIDKAQVFAGVRKLSDAAVGMLAEFSLSAVTNNGAINLRAPGGVTPTYSVSSRGTIETLSSASGFAAPITNIVSVFGDISADGNIIRVNGTQAASNTSDQGTGNYLAYPIYIGRRGGTSLPFNGRIYQMLVRFGANLSAATITQTETFMNSRTGAY